MWAWLKRLLSIGQTPDLFAMKVDSDFDIEGRGRVVVGTISAGRISIGETVFAHCGDEIFPVVATGLCRAHDQSDIRQAGEGETVGILLRGKSASRVQPGSVISHSEEALQL